MTEMFNWWRVIVNNRLVLDPVYLKINFCFCLDNFAENDFEKMDRASQQELLITTMADFLVESSLSIPMTVGIYSHWGNGKSTYTQRLMGKEIGILYKFFVMPAWSF